MRHSIFACIVIFISLNCVLRTQLIRLVSVLHDQLFESVFYSFSSEIYSLIQLIALCIEYLQASGSHSLFLPP